MKRELHLVSPHMKDDDKQAKQLVAGKDVSYAQRLLRENKYGVFLAAAGVDGEFGTETNRACKRAKFWLGYSSKGVAEGGFGDTLELFLLKKKELPLLYAQRRKQRLRKAAATPLREKALVKAAQYIGVKENPPNSNVTMFSKWYGIIGAWCDEFVTYCAVSCGSKSFKQSARYAYVPAMLSDAKMGVNGLALIRKENVLPGHVVTYDWDNDGVADHTGFFKGWSDQGKTKFKAIEGNTSASDNSNGGEVQIRDRSVNDVIGFLTYN